MTEQIQQERGTQDTWVPFPAGTGLLFGLEQATYHCTRCPIGEGILMPLCQAKRCHRSTVAY